MKYSIRYKITGLITILIIAVVFLCWVMNKGFLADYYQYSKIKILGDTFTSVQDIYKTVEMEYENQKDESEIFENKNLALERLGTNGNINVYVFRSYYYTEYFDMTKANLTLDYPVSQSVIDQQREQLSERVGTYLLNRKNNRSVMKELSTSKNYGIYKIYDERMESYYIELFGVLDNGYIIYLRSNFESMQESVRIANKFLAYVGIIGTLMGIIVAMFVSKSFTRPIHQLSGIAKKMAKLDFDVKYTVTTKDEIGELGTSINTLSEKLEETISELKNANNELKSDIQNKIQIDEMRKEFLSNVTHELKTPIALIQGYAEGLLDNINEDEESRNFYCEVIIDEASKMNNMVKRLLSLNQIEFGKNQVNIERFDIVALIHGALNSTNILIQKKEAKVQFALTEPIDVWADEYMIEEVVTNYISNALNHLDYDKIIDIKIEQKIDCVRVSVFNTGDPIPSEDIDKIWIKFYKVDKARTREYGGNGIGLSIVKAIMSSHNRACGVINHDNGVEFWFELDTKI
ncbi:sensor histidine kinase [Anaerosporobacter faecicola]|uniref:sensor histidine kinase n=1 Tax=Anaerosporobacter faecicola TaxID=2718714 RepID=UPI00143BF8F6|nr:HAMP domain-containing sensor histidine kinase [Anaerosporobacter faecicola]